MMCTIQLPGKDKDCKPPDTAQSGYPVTWMWASAGVASTMDSVSKRQLALAIFLALQSWKLYEWSGELPDTISSAKSLLDAMLGYVLRWSIVDLTFIVGLHIARIPKLIWPLPKQIGIFGGIFAFNVAMVILAPIFLINEPGPLANKDDGLIDRGQLTALVDDIAGSKENLYKETSGNIAGEFTLKVRPWAVAKLNPLDTPCCLSTCTEPPNSHSLSEASKRPLNDELPASLNLPLILSGTGPWTVTWEWASSLDRFPSHDRFTEVFFNAESQLTVNKLGYYRLVSVVDGHGTIGKVPPNAKPVKVEACPEARIDGLILINGIDVCVKQKSKHPLKVWLAGQAPFDLRLTRFSGSSSKLLTFDQLSPVDDPIEGISKIGKFNLIPLDIIDFDSPGEHLIRIESVKDATGKQKVYGQWDSGDSVLVTAHLPPSATWILEESSLTLLKGMDHVELRAQLNGIKPFKLEIDLIDPKTGSKQESFSIVSDSRLSFKAKKPGIYRIASISDSVCQGNVVGSPEIQVTFKDLPSVDIKFDPIHSPCNGELGGTFHLSFQTGSAPWNVKYQIDDEHHELESKEQTLSYKWLPDTPGLHQIKFISVSDSYYIEGVPISFAPFKVEVSPLPDAIIQKSQLHTCIGAPSSAIIPIKLTGTGPWKLGINEIFPDGTIKENVLLASESPFDYKVPEMLKQGKFILRLSKIIDSKGCFKEIENQIAQVTVLPILPTAAFQQDSIKAKEGTLVELPIILKGNKGPWKVDVKHLKSNGSHLIKTFTIDSKKKLTVDSAGTYELISVSDFYCTGIVDELSSIRVEVIPMPKVQFTEDSATASCRYLPGKVSTVSLVITGGTGSITVKYTEQTGHDLKDARAKKPVDHQLSLLPGQTTIEIPLRPSQLPGIIIYRLVAVSDEVYDKVGLKGEFVKQIYPDPRPKFIQNAIPVYCLHRHPNAQEAGARLSVDFAGSSIQNSGPYDITFELIDPDGHLKSIQASLPAAPGEISIPDILKPGNYRVRIISVVNGHGCVWSDASDSFKTALANASSTHLHVMQTPNLIQIEPRGHYCVGEVASFQLTGQGPWTIQYALRKPDGTEIRKTDTIKSSSHFTVLLAEPGTIHINSISNARCKLEDPLGGPLNIKKLPSAVIEEAGSQWVHEDETASFKVRLGGEPPFTFTYQRLDESSKDVVLESKTISDVHEYEYTVVVPSVSGTFRIESVQDKYCRYPPRSK